MAIEIIRANVQQMDKATQLEKVARQYSAHREMIDIMGKDPKGFKEDYKDGAGVVRPYPVTPQTIWGEFLIRRALIRDVRDEELAGDIVDKYLKPGERI